MSDEKRPIAYITRCETFSSCHRLHSEHLTKEENSRVFGKCNHENGHGHNYKVEVTLRGEIDPVTGMVYNLTDLKEIMRKAVTDVCDHRNLDKDVPYFEDRTSTAENLAVFVWSSVQGLLPRADLLYKVKIHETDNNTVSYLGE